MGNLQKAKEDFILLAEAGFIAINQGDEDAALKLFRAAELLKPENNLPRIGVGYLHFLKLELKQASKIFEEVITADPKNSMAQAFLGLSLAFSPGETIKGEKLLEQAASDAKDSYVKTMATSAIDFVEKYIKKAPSPAHVSGKTEKKSSKKEKKGK